MESHADLIPKSISRKLPALVRNEVARLNSQKQEEFLEEYKRKRKSAGMAYLLLFLGGFHCAYLRSWGMQILYWLTLGGFIIWAVVDIFRIPSIVSDRNKDAATDVLRNLKAISG
jgi:hypothetical protein